MFPIVAYQITMLSRTVGYDNQAFYKKNIFAFFSLQRIHVSIYVAYLREWLRVFPRDQFFILTTEDWVHRTDPDVLPKVHKFLDIGMMKVQLIHV